MQEFYANAAVSDEEAAIQNELPYKSFVRGKEVDFFPNNIRRVMRFKRETARAQTDYKTRQALNQRLDGVLTDLCIPGAIWKLSSSQPAVPTQKDRIAAISKGLARVHYSFACSNGEQIGTQGLTNKGNLAHPITIYKLWKDASVPLREFTRTPRIPELSYITAKRMETIRFPRNQPQQQQEDEEEDDPMPQADGGNFEEEDQQPPQQDQQPPQHEQEKLAKEIQEVRRSQLAQAVANNKRLEAERNMQLALERQGRDIVEIRKQINLWTNNTSSKEAYAFWAQQQANPNLSEIPITQIPDIMRTNVEKGRPLLHGFLKSDYGASSSSQVDPEEPVPLRTAPPSPHFRPPHPPPNYL
ncbi:hypothetical protein PIB30_068066 [Stylosanthes scabra]|uniref:Uncharacterized protein n=1 Tax=Stylosanthes scabra TaxID=79078 RepID=A0ABU6WMJ6_9FABA|nr:hypothetical protein [Stylosanthes scabra]